MPTYPTRVARGGRREKSGSRGGSPVRAVIVAAAVAFIVSCSARRSRSGSSPRSRRASRSDPSGRKPPGQEGHADDGRGRVHRRHRARLRGRSRRADHPAANVQIAQDGPTMTAFVLLGLFVFCGAVGFLERLPQGSPAQLRRADRQGQAARPGGRRRRVRHRGALLRQHHGQPGRRQGRNSQTVASEHISFVKDISWLDVGKVGSVLCSSS